MLALSFQVRKYKLIPYPFNGGIPGNPTLIQVTSRKSIPTMHSYRFPPYPALCNEIHSCTTLTQRFRLFNIIIEIQKGLSSKKDEKPVVPPSLAEKSAHFTDIKTRMFEYLSLVTMRRSPKPTTLKGSVWGSEVHSLYLPTLICTNHQLSKVSKKSYYSSSQPYALFVNNHNINFIIRQLYF